MSIQETMDRIADHIEKVGWTQGKLFDCSTLEGGQLSFGRPAGYELSRPCCLVGGARVVTGAQEHGLPRVDYDRAIAELSLRVGDKFQTELSAKSHEIRVSWWNDAQGRTKEEVLKLLRTPCVDHK